MRHVIRFLRRGQVVELSHLDPRLTLLDWLRLEERSTGTKEGCAEGDCGACTVALRRLKDGRLVTQPVNSCILLMGQVDGAELITVEDLASGETLHPVQQAMVDHHGSQCGFCTPGIVMSLFAAYQDEARPLHRDTINDVLAGNLCRCTGYRPIIDSALAAGAAPPDDAFKASAPDVAAKLMALDTNEAVHIGDDRRFFAAPRTEDQLAQLLLDHPDATIVAGATDVGLWITKALEDPQKIVWLGRIRTLQETENFTTSLRLGAMVSHDAAMPLLAKIDPDLGEIMRRFGSRQVRASGTIGGNIANGSPIGDLAPALIALGATLHLRRGEERRDLPLEDFFLAYRKQDRRPSEFVTGVTVSKLADGEHFRAYKVSKRFDEDISAVMAAMKIGVADLRITTARIAYGGMAGTPKRAIATEQALIGLDLAEPGSWHGALDALAQDYQPLSDQRASAAYRARVARHLLFKALAEIATGSTARTRLIAHREAAHAGA